MDGITLYMQPVQDLTVEDRVSRTQYQYSLEDPDAKELAVWVPRFIEKLQSLPQLRDVASDQQNGGLETTVRIDRGTSSRFGITPQVIDDTLYDAFGQRQISTMFTQLNQYRVVLEVKPDLQKSPDSLGDLYIRSDTGGEVPLSAITHVRAGNAPLGGESSGAIPGGNGVVQSGAGSLAGRRGGRDESRLRKSSTCRPACRGCSRARPRRFKPRWRTSRS